MKILVLIDKFKNSLSSITLSKIIKSTLTNHEVDYFPISDGGDGFLDSINYNKQFKRKYLYVKNALNEKCRVYYLIKDDTAYIEVAKIIGFNKNNKLDILNATSFGVGQVILDAITNKVTNFYIGLGGTISNDGGKGMLEALGFEFKEKVIKNSSIDYSKFNFHIISDVKNTLLGKNGATYTYAIQKGAVKSLLPVLEHKMKEFSDKITNFLSVDYTNHIGSGAAGGLGFAFLSILNAKYHNGINFILNHLNIDSIVDKYDLIITGEGKIDYQSLQGKIVFELLSRYNKKILILCAINDVKNKNNTIKSIVPDITCVEKSLKRPKYYFTKLIKSLKL